MKVRPEAATRGREHTEQVPSSNHAPTARREIRGPISAALALLAAGAAKFKLLLTAVSAVVAIGAYSLWFGWPFATGLVALIAVHEMGHMIQLRREGINATAPVFVPFLGAVIAARSLGDDALAEARVGLAGPVLGALGTAAVAVPGFLTGSHLLLALAYAGSVINLFNLLPVVPLDGGRAMAAVAPRIWWLTLAVLVGVALLERAVVLVIVIVLAAMELPTRRRGRRTADPLYYDVSRRDRLLIAGVYVALVALLGAGMDATHLAGAEGASR